MENEKKKKSNTTKSEQLNIFLFLDHQIKNEKKM